MPAGEDLRCNARTDSVTLDKAEVSATYVLYIARNVSMTLRQLRNEFSVAG